MEKSNKRKRLEKACDACHKSKRRCDGTAPCSNCYYASKACSYTDSSGRPVAAPRLESPTSDSSRKRTRPSDTTGPSLLAHPVERPPHPNLNLDPAMIRELTNLFFAHCQPISTIIHQSTFTQSMTLSSVPIHLLYAICAISAPYSCHPSLQGSIKRLAGKRFADETRRCVFDESGERLTVAPSLDVAQTLALLYFYEWVTQGEIEDSMATGHSPWIMAATYRRFLVELLSDLNVHLPEHPLVTPVSTNSFVTAVLDRECARRVFWIIYILDGLRTTFYRSQNIALSRPSSQPSASVSLFPRTPPSPSSFYPTPSYSHLSHPSPLPYRDDGYLPSTAQQCPSPNNFTDAELRLRLPCDEASFELAHVHESPPEYLYLPGAKTQYASEMGHMIRAISIHQKSDMLLDDVFKRMSDSSVSCKSLQTPAAIQQVLSLERTLEEWHQSLPDHLLFSGQTLATQKSMLATSANTGAWFWAAMHAFHVSAVLGICMAKHWLASRSPDDKQRISSAFEKHDALLKMFGDRIGNSIILAPLLWPLLKLCVGLNSNTKSWVEMYSKSFGVRLDIMVEKCRACWIDSSKRFGYNLDTRTIETPDKVTDIDASLNTNAADQQVLPSLKASGLLDFSRGGVGVPVGLPWLANERN